MVALATKCFCYNAVAITVVFDNFAGSAVTSCHVSEAKNKKQIMTNHDESVR